MLQVTLNTSLQLGGRTTEFPRSDFNRLVIRFTRHTLLLNNIWGSYQVNITSWKVASSIANALNKDLIPSLVDGIQLR